MGWIKDNIISLILAGLIIYIIFSNNTIETENKGLIDKLRNDLRLDSIRIRKDSIRYYGRLDTLNRVNRYLNIRLTQNKQNYENEKEQFEAITSDSTFIHINDSIERFISSGFEPRNN